ncbi:MAG: hypothetical protein UY09_C0037G0003 [Parcubacteria group bacterium GW2011_GWA2_47_8]|nr:MAG: hypothetical protein UY09_C0037G0003 [Parcubacteria group bacterium GW2011_GWA2_47_8]
MRRVVVATIFVTLLFGLSIFGNRGSQAATGINGTITYQAKLTDTASTAISDGSYNFRFRLYSASSGGSLLWSEQWSSASSTQIAVTSGLLTVALGTHTALSSVDFNSDALWLQVEFDADSSGSFEEVFSPRRRLTAVPYAFNADQLDGKSEAEFADTSENETITGRYTFSATTTFSATSTFSRAINVTGISTLATSTFSKLLTVSGGGLTVSSGIITLPSGQIDNSELATSTVNYGGVKLSLGQADISPAFNLADATGLPLTTGVSGILQLANGGIGASLADPNADRIFFWDDSATSTAFLTVGSGLQVSGTTLSVNSTGLNADTVDSLHAAAFLRATSSTTFAAGNTLTIAGHLAITGTTTAATTTFTKLLTISGGASITGIHHRRLDFLNSHHHLQ